MDAIEIKIELIKAGIKQRDLAEALGIHEVSLCHAITEARKSERYRQILESAHNYLSKMLND